MKQILYAIAGVGILVLEVWLYIFICKFILSFGLSFLTVLICLAPLAIFAYIFYKMG